MESSPDQLDALFDRITDAVVAVDPQWRYTFVNAKAGQLLERRPQDLLGRNIWDEFPEGPGQPLRRAYERAMREQCFLTLEAYYPPDRRWFENRIHPSSDGLTIFFEDVTSRKRRELADAGHREILTMVATQQPLAAILGRLALLHESLNPGAVCSVLLLDSEGKHVVHGAAPSLGSDFNRSIDGEEIGPAHGSCGTAAWTRQRVVVADIADHPYWEKYRAIALAHGLRACWSTPIIGSTGDVVGTFAVYYPDSREPSADELEDIDRVVPVACIAIESARLLARMRERDRFFELSMEINCIFDPATGRIVQANPAFTAITGFSEQELCSQPYGYFVHPLDRGAAAAEVDRLERVGGKVAQFAYRFLCKDGSYRWLEWESFTVPDGLAYAVARDITERHIAQEALEFAASHDAISGLANFVRFESTLAQWIAAGTRQTWVMFLGLDRFQLVNDVIGNVAGDAVLKTAACRLRTTLAGRGEIARYAGDQFVVAIPDATRDEAMAMAESLRAAVTVPIESNDYPLLLTTSIGICHYPGSGDNPKDLLRRAETAMRQVKREGRDGVREFSAMQMQHLEDFRTLGGPLRDAIDNGELALHFQPQFRADPFALSGFEALLRWNNPRLGNIAPARFIPVAEALGLMPEVGRWVVRESCRQARRWLDFGFSGFTIAINVSAEQLQRPGLVEQVRNAATEHGIAASMLEIELTESALIENLARTQLTLAGLKQLGARLSLDDFGTGYSSLAYLKQFPIDKLKIDRSFVCGLPGDPDDAAIAKTIIAMAHQLRMTVAAEGVETAEQSSFLSAIGCDELQGFHLGRPSVASEAERYFGTVVLPV